MKKLILTSVLQSIVIISLLPVLSTAQNITTIAGCGIGDDSLAIKAELTNPMGVALDNFGNIYVSDASYRVRKINAAGVISTFAGDGVAGNSGNGGPATAANFGYYLYSTAIDRQGNIYIADGDNNYIWKVDTSGIISIVAGTGVAGFFGDNGQATAAELNKPTDVVIDTSGNIIIADMQNYRVRKIDTAGIITTIVGDGLVDGTGNNGPATASELGAPFCVTLDKKGNLYIAETEYDCICKVDTAGIITVIAGTGVYAAGADGDGGLAIAATMTQPDGLAVDTSGNLYFSDTYNERIRKVDMNTGIISTYVGTGIAGYSGDGGAATAAQVSTPEGLAYDAAGNLFICDDENNRIREVSTTGIISTVAGQNGLFGEGYNAANAELCIPTYVTIDDTGNVYIADFYNNRVRKINGTTGIITTVAGSGIAGYVDPYSGDNGPATLANIYGPDAVAVDHSGNLYISDNNGLRIRKVNNLGIITTIAGNGTAGYSGDNIAATASELNYPAGIAVDNSGNVYVADGGNNRIRKINSAGIISTVAGTGFAGYSGDNAAATNAKLTAPTDVTLDSMGNLYIADEGNNRVRKVDTAGIITTIAGTGTAGFSGDGEAATAAQLYYPLSVKMDNAGNIYIADAGNQRVRMINTSGIINTLAGNGIAGFSGDGGPAVNAMLNGPQGVATDHSGDLYIADTYNDRIRKMMLPLSVPTVNASAMNVSVYPNPATGAVNIINAANCNFILYDAVGKEIMKGTITASQQTLDISNLASGVYILQVTNGNGENKMVKVVKE